MGGGVVGVIVTGDPEPVVGGVGQPSLCPASRVAGAAGHRGLGSDSDSAPCEQVVSPGISPFTTSCSVVNWSLVTSTYPGP